MYLSLVVLAYSCTCNHGDIELVYSSLVELDPSIDSRLSQTLSSASLPVEVISNALVLVEALIACGHGKALVCCMLNILQWNLA